ncbi:MAG: 50S ribosomal protein L4 [Fuerstiella sp.]|nr:50S ribosomal protein L4 [Fuerstiella sp.]
MISVSIRDMAGIESGSYEFDPAELAAGVSRQLLHDAVVMYEANRRVGTVRTKSRGMVRGSTKKLYRQKGTGRARAGSARGPVRRGGGHAFAKKPRDYSYRMPRKSLQLATKMALLSKFQDDQAIMLSQWDCSEPKTKVVAQSLKSLGVAGTSVLLATDCLDPNLWRSARNIQDVRVMPAADLNAWDLLRHRNLVVTVAAMDQLLGRSSATTA